MTTTPEHRDADTPALFRPARRPFTAAAAALTLLAGAAEARDVSPAPEPVVIEYESGSDCLFWDLCLDEGASHASGELARAVIEQMTDPAALYVVRAPELPAAWEAPPAGLLRDADGERIERRQLSLNRRHYEAMVERALIGVLDQVRSERPEAAVSIEGYRTLSIRNGRRQVYSGLESELSFLSFPDGSKATDARSLDRWLDRQGVGDAGTALVETGDGWVLVGGGELLEALEAPLEAEYVDAWPAGEGSAAESMAGPAQRELGESMSEGQNHSVTDTGLAMLPHLRSAADGIESPRDPDSGEGDADGEEEAPGGGDGEPEGGPEGGEEETNPGADFLLKPGPGFSGPTPQPAPRGIPSQPGYDARAIARWDVVPYQVFDGEFQIGVVAFHRDGIHRVDFSVNGTDPEDIVSVYQPTMNDRTGVVEYWATLDASMFDDGLVEVRAIVYPNTGEPRVLAGDMSWENEYRNSQWTGEHSMFLFANAGGGASELTLELPSGSYEWGDLPGVPSGVSDERWLNIKPVEGADVTILPGVWSGQPNMIHLQDVKLVQPGTEAALRGSADNVLWIDRVEYTGSGMWERAIPVKAEHTFWTDSTVRESQYGQAQQFVRGCTFEQIGEDTLKLVYMLINTDVTNTGEAPGDTGWHPAVIANPIEHDNRIYYGVNIKARHKAWALRNGTHEHWEHRDVAIVDCRTEKTQEGNQMFYLGGRTQHMLIEDCDFLGYGGWNFRLADDLPNPEWQFDPSDVMLRNNNWWNDPDWIPTPTELEGVEIEMIGR